MPKGFDYGYFIECVAQPAVEEVTEEILVTADFRQAELSDFATSASRGRFFQIRGIGERTTWDFTGLYVDVDNGYDGFSLYNTRTTIPGRPGYDRQETLAGSARLQWQANVWSRLCGSDLFAY